ncbi:hypothetical protein ACFXTN_025386 [Malus domestica]
MASSLALSHLLSANRFPKSFTISTIHPLAITHSPASKLFNTNVLRSSDDDNNESDLNFDRRSSRHFFRRGEDFFSNVFVPFSLRPNLSLVLNLIDRISENPIISMTRTGGARRPKMKLARRPLRVNNQSRHRLSLNTQVGLLPFLLAPQLQLAAPHPDLVHGSGKGSDCH